GTGALTGTVKDATGAVIPGVTVTLTSTDTNQTRSTITGEEGSYRFALLPPGTYGVRFSIPGFKTSEVSLVTVRVTETLVLDRALEVGAPSEQVTVETQTETTLRFWPCRPGPIRPPTTPQPSAKGRRTCR